MDNQEENLSPGAAGPIPPITPESIADRLSGGGENGSQATATDEPVAVEPMPAFDISRLSVEQLQALKGALEGVPLTKARKKGNPIVKLRRMEGRFVVDFKNCFTAMRKDVNTEITSEVVIIPVRFMDEKGHGEVEVKEGKTVPKFTHVVWKDFMNADQVKCEVVSTRRVPGSLVEGEVESNERPGVMVEMEVRTIQDFFTVKLPEGSPVPTVEIEGKIANA